jgi:hypothetical protein
MCFLYNFIFHFVPFINPDQMSKCEFGKTSLVYFGYIVGGGELRIDPSKFEAITKWNKPNNVT